MQAGPYLSSAFQPDQSQNGSGQFDPRARRASPACLVWGIRPSHYAIGSLEGQITKERDPCAAYVRLGSPSASGLEPQAAVLVYQMARRGSAESETTLLVSIERLPGLLYLGPSPP